MGRDRDKLGQFIAGVAPGAAVRPRVRREERVTPVRVLHGTFAETVQLRGATITVYQPLSAWERLAIEALKTTVHLWLGDTVAELAELAAREPRKPPSAVPTAEWMKRQMEKERMRTWGRITPAPEALKMWEAVGKQLPWIVEIGLDLVDVWMQMP